MNKCYFCKGPIVKGRVRVIRQRDGQVIVIENVPAQLCTQCGERYYSATVCRALDKLMDQAPQSTTHLTVPVVEFEGEPAAATS